MRDSGSTGWIRRHFVLAVLLALAAPAQVAGQEADSTGLDLAAAQVASQLRCPVCRNQSVLESSSELAREMQRLIREKLEAGESPEAVTEYFVGKYGEWILLRPEPSGINILVYLLPAAVLLLGALVLQGRLRRWVRAGTTSRAVAFSATNADAAGNRGASARNSGSGEGASPDSARISEENERWLAEALRE